MTPYIDFLFEKKSYYEKLGILGCQILLRYWQIVWSDDDKM